MRPLSGTTDHSSHPPATACPTLLRDFLHDSVGCLRRLYQNHGNLVTFAKGQARAFFAFGPDSNRVVLTNPEVYHFSGGFPGPKKSAHRRFGQGLFGLNGEAHQRARRLLMPPFRKEAVEAHRDVLVQLTEQFLAGWHEGREVDLAHAVREFVLRITTQVLFGIEDFERAQAVEAAFEDWVERNHEIFFAALLPIDCPEVRYDELIEAAERLEQQLQALVRQRQAAPARRDDVLSLLLRARDAGELADVEVIGHMHSFFNAAYHTSTAALTWTLFLLAQHPQIMRQLLTELEGTLGGAAPTVGQLNQLPVLERVIKESMRVLPPVVYAPRIVMQPTDFGPHRLERGTLMVTSHYVTHHLPELYPEPDRFVPDRWLHATPSPYAYLPFGAGPRMCIGAPFVLVMLKVVVPLICQRYRLTVVPGARVDRKSDITLSPRSGIPVWIRRQDHRFTTSPIEGNIHEILQLPLPEMPAATAA